jgi:hypothetical protein
MVSHVPLDAPSWTVPLRQQAPLGFARYFSLVAGGVEADWPMTWNIENMANMTGKELRQGEQMSN